MLDQPLLDPNMVIKAWISVFVCLSTGAVHFELVSNATSAAFMAAFIARREIVRKIISDNGTHFVGTAMILREVMRKE